MDIKQIVSKCNEIKNGSFFKVTWMSDCNKNLKAAAKKADINVQKYVSSLCRKGIHYGQIKSVQEEKKAKGQYLVDPATGKEEYIVEQRAWAEDVIPNLIIKHKNTGKHYMVLYSSATKPQVQYYLNSKPITQEALKKLGIMCDSYWNKNDKAAVMTIPVESIRTIG